MVSATGTDTGAETDGGFSAPPWIVNVAGNRASVLDVVVAPGAPLLVEATVFVPGGTSGGRCAVEEDVVVEPVLGVLEADAAGVDEDAGGLELAVVDVEPPHAASSRARHSAGRSARRFIPAA